MAALQFRKRRRVLGEEEGGGEEEEEDKGGADPFPEAEVPGEGVDDGVVGVTGKFEVEADEEPGDGNGEHGEGEEVPGDEE